MQQPAGSKEKCLVVGGAGFLGRHIVDALVNDYEVTTFDVRESGDPSAKAIIGDITKPDSITDACKGRHPPHTDSNSWHLRSKQESQHARMEICRF